MLRRLWKRVGEPLRRDFVAGLLVFIPIGFTVLGVLWIIQQLDNLVLPKIFDAFGIDSRDYPLLGVFVTLVVILAAGALTRSFVGRAALGLWERTVERVPVARSLYSIVKQFMEALFGSGPHGTSFSRVVIIQYPRKGIYTYAFVTGRVENPVPRLPEGLIKVFVPSTPNPTTGYFLLLDEEELIATGLTVEEAFKLIISAGIADEGNGGRPGSLWDPPAEPAASPDV